MMYRIFSKIQKIYRRLVSLKYKLILGSFGKKSLILNPMSIDSPKSIFVGDNVLVQQNVWLAANTCELNVEAQLVIKNNVTLGHFNHIYATKKIVIENGVLTADRVYIGDSTHCYQDPNIYIKNQGVHNLGKITIGEGSWLGEGVCVVGANIGKHCVIGANSVVTRDVPDYCVAVGSPAKIIKKYNAENNIWEKV